LEGHHQYSFPCLCDVQTCKSQGICQLLLTAHVTSWQAKNNLSMLYTHRYHENCYFEPHGWLQWHGATARLPSPISGGRCKIRCQGRREGNQQWHTPDGADTIRSCSLRPLERFSSATLSSGCSPSWRLARSLIPWSASHATALPVRLNGLRCQWLIEKLHDVQTIMFSWLSAARTVRKKFCKVYHSAATCPVIK
jgi:hypothetical protein